MSDLRPGKPEALIRLRPGARVLGLTAADVATQLRTAFYGATAGELQVGTESYEVDVRLAADEPGRLRGPRLLPRHAARRGKQVPLGTVASVEEARGYARIARVDGRRTVTIQAEVDTHVANTAEILARFETRPPARASRRSTSTCRSPARPRKGARPRPPCCGPSSSA